MKTKIGIIIVIIGLILFTGCYITKDNKNVNLHHALIEIENYGNIEIELYEEIAPITVENFIKLVNEHFYDGLTFHRIIKGFMMQGGDPTIKGKNQSSTIKGEFSTNGVKNTLSHERGVISMARANANDSASSQFFIMQNTNTTLDGKYAAFGKVTKGMFVVDKICDTVQVEDNNGTTLIENQPIIKQITMID